MDDSAGPAGPADASVPSRSGSGKTPSATQLPGPAGKQQPSTALHRVKSKRVEGPRPAPALSWTSSTSHLPVPTEKVAVPNQHPFTTFELNLFRQCKDRCKCPACGRTGRYSSKGTAGNVNQDNFRRVRIVCSCGRSTSLQRGLEATGDPVAKELQDWNTQFEIHTRPKKTPIRILKGKGPADPPTGPVQATLDEALQRAKKRREVGAEPIEAELEAGELMDTDSQGGLADMFAAPPPVSLSGPAPHMPQSLAPSYASVVASKLTTSQPSQAAPPTVELRDATAAGPTSRVDPEITALRLENAALRQRLDELTASMAALTATLQQLLGQPLGQPGTRQPPPIPLQQARGSGQGGRQVPGLDQIDINPQRSAAAPVEEEDWHTVGAHGRTVQARQTADQAAQESKARLRRRTRAINAAITPRKPALQFQRVFFTLQDSRPILAAPGPERMGMIRGLLRRLNIHRQVSGISIIPGPIIQLICPVGSVESVECTLQDEGLDVLEEVNPFATHPRSRMSLDQADAATARRLAALCRQSKSRNFHETALEGATPELRELALSEFRRMYQQPDALLGHQGRMYSSSMVVDSASI